MKAEHWRSGEDLSSGLYTPQTAGTSITVVLVPSNVTFSLSGSGSSVLAQGEHWKRKLNGYQSVLSTVRVDTDFQVISTMHATV